MQGLYITVCLVLISLTEPSLCGKNKYSKEANLKSNNNYEKKVQFVDEPNVNIRDINKPFRMAKLNLLWTKAQHVSRMFHIEIY